MRQAANLLSCIQGTNSENVCDSVFEEGEALGRSERERPANETEIHAVRTVVRERSRFSRLVLFFRHDKRISETWA